MTKPASTSKTARKQYIPEFRDEALKLAERIGVVAAARELSQIPALCLVQQAKECPFFFRT